MITKEMLKNINGDQILEALGLERRTAGAAAIVPALGVFGVGLLIGAAIGMVFAPKTGGELRSEVANRFGDLKTRFNGESADRSAS